MQPPPQRVIWERERSQVIGLRWETRWIWLVTGEAATGRRQLRLRRAPSVARRRRGPSLAQSVRSAARPRRRQAAGPDQTGSAQAAVARHVRVRYESGQSDRGDSRGARRQCAPAAVHPHGTTGRLRVLRTCGRDHPAAAIYRRFFIVMAGRRRRAHPAATWRERTRPPRRWWDSYRLADRLPAACANFGHGRRRYTRGPRKQEWHVRRRLTHFVCRATARWRRNPGRVRGAALPRGLGLENRHVDGIAAVTISATGSS